MSAEGTVLKVGDALTLVPIADYTGQPNTVSLDYPYVAEEAEPGTQVLLDDGLLELRVEKVDGTAVHCKVVEGGYSKVTKA